MLTTLLLLIRHQSRQPAIATPHYLRRHHYHHYDAAADTRRLLSLRMPLATYAHFSLIIITEMITMSLSSLDRLIPNIITIASSLIISAIIA